jgi:hypothetical protein
MKVRIVKDPVYRTLFLVQVKRWWLPLWLTTFYGSRIEADNAYKNLIEHGTRLGIIEEGYVK